MFRKMSKIHRLNYDRLSKCLFMLKIQLLNKKFQLKMIGSHLRSTKA